MSVSEWSGRPDERERADLPSSVAAPGRTPVAEGDGTPEGRTDDLRADLARRLARSEGWSQPTHMHRVQADELISQGWRLVSEDDATVERVAEQTRKHALDVGRSNRSQDADYCTCGELIEDWDVHWVRAAVRALREAPQDVDLCQGCGNPKSEGLHGMSEYGGCV